MSLGLDFLFEEYLNMNRSQIILLMEDILHQLIGSASNFLQYQVLYVPGGAGLLPSTVSCPLHLPPNQDAIVERTSLVEFLSQCISNIFISDSSPIIRGATVDDSEIRLNNHLGCFLKPCKNDRINCRSANW